MRRASLISLIVLGLCSLALADTISINSTTGVWVSVVPVGVASGEGTASIRWGTDIGSGQSGYDFAGVPPPTQNAIDTGDIFQLGTFTHLNRPILGSSITGATLNLTLNMGIPSGATNVTQTFSYNFSHNETPNVAGTCLPGSVTVCDDEVKVLNTIPTSTIAIGGTLYTIEFLGFSKDGGVTIVNDFLTAENADNTATLYGRFTTNVIQTPEPGALALLAIGFGPLFALVRRRK